MCADCNALQLRPLHEIDLQGDPKVNIPKRLCHRCSAKNKQYVPQLEDVPEKLRGLSDEAILALRPIEVNVGEEKRSTDVMGRWNGYRKKVRMITFLFATQPVKEKIKEVDDRAMQKKSKQAHKFSLADDASEYKRFHDMHEKFLNKHGEDASERKRQRPYQFLQEVGLECALWPHLYWKTSMCETYEQWSDVRRVENRDAEEKNKKKASGEDSESSNDTESDEDGEDGQRTSVKRCFMAKCMSPVLGYGSNFELHAIRLRFDSLATLGGKKNLGLDVPMRVMMNGHTFSSLYWKDVHNALVDLVRQVGFPKLFFTIATWRERERGS